MLDARYVRVPRPSAEADAPSGAFRTPSATQQDANREAMPATPPTIDSKPIPPSLNHVGSVQRTSMYIDALEQLRDEEVLADSVAKPTVNRRRTTRRGPVVTSDMSVDTKRLSNPVLETVRQWAGRARQAAVAAAGGTTTEPAKSTSRGTSSTAASDQYAEGKRKFTIFSSADGEDSGPSVDHTRQRTCVRRLAAFCSRKALLLEFVFLASLGVLSALLALWIGFVLDKADSLRDVLTNLAEHMRDSWLLESGTELGSGVAVSELAMRMLYLLPFATFLFCSLCYATVALYACLPSPHGPGSRHASGSGIPELKAILSGYWLARYLSARAFISKLVGLNAALAAGLFIGREGPMVHLSAALSTLLMKLPAFEATIEHNHQRKRAMLGAACAAGVVATFGTPIGGVLFSVEVTATYYMVNNLWRGFVCSIACIICFQALQDYELVETIPETRINYIPHVGFHYAAFILLGVLQGVLSALIVQLMSAIAQRLKRYGFLRPVAPRVATTFAVCTFAAACKFLLPMGGVEGTDLLDGLFDQEDLPGLPVGRQDTNASDTAAVAATSWSICATPLRGLLSTPHAWDDVVCSPLVGLSLFILVELPLLLFSIVLPVPNGCFMPIFILGAATGRLHGALLRRLLGYDATTLPDAVMAVVGAASLAAGTTFTLSTALMTIELTAQQDLINPVLIGVIVSCGVAGILSKSIFDQILVLKGLPYMPHLSDSLRSERLYHMTARDIMRPTAAVVAAAKAAHGKGNSRNESILHKNDKLVVKREEVSDGQTDEKVDSYAERLIDVSLPSTNPYHPANAQRQPDDRMERPVMPLSCDMTVREVLATARLCRDRYIPLVESRATPTLLGALTRAQLLEWFAIEVEIGKEEAAEQALLTSEQAALSVGEPHDQRASRVSSLTAHLHAQKRSSVDVSCCTSACGGRCAVSFSTCADSATLPPTTPRPSTLKIPVAECLYSGSMHTVSLSDSGGSGGCENSKRRSGLECSGSTLSSFSAQLVSVAPPSNAASPVVASSFTAGFPAATSSGTASSSCRRLSSAGAAVLAISASRRRSTRRSSLSSGGGRRDSLSFCHPATAFAITERGLEGSADVLNASAVNDGHSPSARPFTQPSRWGERSRSDNVGTVHGSDGMRNGGACSGGDDNFDEEPLAALLPHSELRSEEFAPDAVRMGRASTSPATPAPAMTQEQAERQQVAARIIQAKHREAAAHSAAHRARVASAGSHKPSSSSYADAPSSQGRDHLFRRMDSRDAEDEKHVETIPSDQMSPPISAESNREFDACGDGHRGESHTSLLKVSTSDVGATKSATQKPSHGQQTAAACAPLEGTEKWLGELDRPFPWDEIEWNRCALQLASQTALDEIHNLFSFMNMGQVWVTAGGRLEGVVTDRAIIDLCLHGSNDLSEE